MSAAPTQALSPPRFKPPTVVYWMRAALAILAAFANQILHFNEAKYGALALFMMIGLGVIFYMISVFIVRKVLNYGEAELKGKNKHITLGGGTFIILWITVSVLLYTIYG